MPFIVPSNYTKTHRVIVGAIHESPVKETGKTTVRRVVAPYKTTAIFIQFIGQMWHLPLQVRSKIMVNS